jgi:hypothetical protein
MTTERGSEHKKPLADVIKDAIDKGTTRVEKIHKSIADLPLRMLEETDLLKGPAKEVRRVQDHAIEAVYDLIRTINRQVGTVASDLRHELGKRRGAQSEATARHQTGAGHA